MPATFLYPIIHLSHSLHLCSPSHFSPQVSQSIHVAHPSTLKQSFYGSTYSKFSYQYRNSTTVICLSLIYLPLTGFSFLPLQAFIPISSRSSAFKASSYSKKLNCYALSSSLFLPTYLKQDTLGGKRIKKDALNVNILKHWCEHTNKISISQTRVFPGYKNGKTH